MGCCLPGNTANLRERQVDNMHTVSLVPLTDHIQHRCPLTLVAYPFRSLSPHTQTNNNRVTVHQFLGRRPDFSQLDLVLVRCALRRLGDMTKPIDRHRADQLLIPDRLARIEVRSFRIQIDPVNPTLTCSIRGELSVNVAPDRTRSTSSWESEGRVGSPVAGGGTGDDVLDDDLEVRCGYSFA